MKDKTLGKKDLVLFTVSAILLLDTLASAATVGVSSIFWWLFLGLTFFLPFALISAEMSCSYPEQGGIYAWIKTAYGSRWAARASWGYWVNTAVWIPAISILFAGIFKQLFFPDLSLSSQIAIGITLTWITVAVNIVSLDIGKFVPDSGAILKVLIFLVLIIAGFNHVSEHGMANDFSMAALKPDWQASFQYIPAIIYGMLGFELVSASSQEMKNPARDMPKAVLISALIIILLYIFGTIAMLAAIPSQDINLVEGLMDTLYLLMGDTPAGKTFAFALGIAALYTFFTNGVTWALGCNRAAAEAAKVGELPKIFAWEIKKTGTPLGASIMMGLVSTVTILLYGVLAGSNEDLFWSLFAFSAVIFMLPYIAMMLAFIKSRIDDPEHVRPYKIPGGIFIARLFAFSCITILSMAIVLFIYSPEEGMQWMVLAGVVVTIAIGEMIILSTEKSKASTASTSITI
ncbi:APC family permease [Thalassotalea fonticola]|uniref:APC family permease n=1 Tax=Thalassotalea fonticola TaxID=3065649 RepID=A0ABZ0GMD7_9GAMM|nr:APC family permease [Colwelliaceae bacterium S1-1]